MTGAREIVVIDPQLKQFAGQEAWHGLQYAWVYRDELTASEHHRPQPEDRAQLQLRRFLDTLPARYKAYAFNTLRQHPGNLNAIEAARDLNTTDNLYIWGNAGNGKTHLAIALAQERAKTHQAAFWSIATLFSTLRQAAISQAEWPDLVGPDLLILDDLGKAKATEFVFQEAYRILEQRWAEQRSTIFTANHKPSDAAARITDDPASQQALTSRLAAGTVVKVEGNDQRILSSSRDSR